MIAVSKPSSYSDWIRAFENIKSYPLSQDSYYELELGRLDTYSSMSHPFNSMLTDTINVVLNRCIDSFSRELDMCLSFNEIDNIELVFSHLKTNVRRVFFFERLGFLPDSVKNELSEKIKEQMSAFWNTVVNHLTKEAMNNQIGALEDTLFLIKRIKLF
ncbi:MAG: hypothetical protein IJW54_05335 [Clostridia bacterium]|nr:hypothetical protein [Clostridia bacterium]